MREVCFKIAIVAAFPVIVLLEFFSRVWDEIKDIKWYVRHDFMDNWEFMTAIATMPRPALKVYLDAKILMMKIERRMKK